jgi:creatinine amidohydrolase
MELIMQAVKMGEMTVNELQQYLKKKRTIILPYGVVEQHGHHLPLDTDIRNAEIMGEKLAEKLACIVAPTLNYCFSGGMLTGTINVKPNTFSNMMGEIVESLALQGFQNIIILPGHGGSESLQHLKESLRILKWLNPALKNTTIILVQLWDFSPTWLKLFKTRDYHAGEAETSLIKFWTPEAVRRRIVMDKTAVAEMLRDDPDSYQKRSSFTGLNDEIPFTEQRSEVKIGVMGYPEKAAAATGRKITEEILSNASVRLKKTIALADKARKNGTAVEIKNNDKLKIFSL